MRFYQAPVAPPAPSISLANLITNGSFETDTSGWTGSLTLSRQAMTASHGESGGGWYARNTGSVNGAHWFQRSSALSVVSGRQYYLRCQTAVATLSYGFTVQFFNNTAALAGVASFNVPTANTWYLYDAVWTANTTSLTLRVNHSGGSGNQTRTGWLDNVVMLDLTATFGGSIPAIADLRQMVSGAGGWWEGTIST